MAQVAPGKSLLFSYDANGQAVSVNYNGTEYYYLRNGQNDIVGLMDESGVRVVEYIYDAWGKLISTTGTLATTLGADNPFRYRGYYYDTETGLYYLTTRYYDPEVCRFISADVYTSTGQGVLGGNMWAYCLNNPIVYTDDEGTIAGVDDAALLLFFLATALVISITALIDVTLNRNAATVTQRHKDSVSLTEVAISVWNTVTSAFTLPRKIQIKLLSQRIQKPKIRIHTHDRARRSKSVKRRKRKKITLRTVLGKEDRAYLKSILRVENIENMNRRENASLGTYKMEKVL